MYVGERINHGNMYWTDAVRKGESRERLGKRIKKIPDEEGRGEEWITEIERGRRERSASEGEERGRTEKQEWK